MDPDLRQEATECLPLDMADMMAEFGFSGVTAFRKAQGGRVNENWIVRTTEAEVVVRCVAKERSLNDLRFEHTFINALHQSGLPYRFPNPLLSTSGDAIVAKSGLYLWLYEYIEGRTLRSYRPDLTEEIATAMASLHKVAQGFHISHPKISPLAIEDPWLLDTMKFWQQKLQTSSDERLRYFCQHVPECISILERICSAQYRALRRFPIHGDWCMANLVFAGEQIIGIIDFDHCCSDTAIRDISAFLQYECVDATYPFKLDIPAAQYFIECYNRVNPLSREETALIPAVAIAESADAFWWKMYEITNNRGGTVTLSRIENLFETLRWYSGNDRDIARALCTSQNARV
jgi:Ser/Thr protein kinase RdoA (MazF antagonist)